ncbi:MAG: hypothetical protein C0501_00740 [Isosphaera sp.]|nr:hypothetical protein [Isosphaera sp.]
MNRFRGWGLSAAVAAAGGSALAAGPPGPVERTTLVNKLFGPKAPKPTGPVVGVGNPAAVSAPLPPAAVAEAVRNEQDAYVRRLLVCDKLRQVAAEKGDDDLARRADELERQAAALYNARVAALGVLKGKVPLPGGPPAETVAAQAGRLAAPAAPTPGDTASSKVWEVKP